MGLSDQEEWGDDDHIDMGDHLAVADEPPAVEYGLMEGADGGAGVPTTNIHPPDPTHTSTPDSSPVADEDMGAPDPDRDVDTREEEETERVDVIVKEEYFKQEEELDYEDNVPTEEQPVDVSEYKAKCPGIWNPLGEPVDDYASTDTKTSEMATLMENVLGIQSPEGTHEANGRGESSHSHHSDQQHTVLSDDSRRSKGYSSDSSQLCPLISHPNRSS